MFANSNMFVYYKHCLNICCVICRISHHIARLILLEGFAKAFIPSVKKMLLALAFFTTGFRKLNSVWGPLFQLIT